MAPGTAETLRLHECGNCPKTSLVYSVLTIPLYSLYGRVLWSLLALLCARADGIWLAELDPGSIPEWVIVTIRGSPIQKRLYSFNGYL